MTEEFVECIMPADIFKNQAGGESLATGVPPGTTMQAAGGGEGGLRRPQFFRQSSEDCGADQGCRIRS